MAEAQPKPASNGSSSLQTLKMLGKAALAVTKTAAIAAKDATVKTVNELKKAPSEIKCSNCPLTLQVPANLFDWACETPSCKAKNVKWPNEAVACDTCKATKPKQGDRMVMCSVCKHTTVVPWTNASKHLNTAKDKTVAAAIAVKDYTSKTVSDLKAPPTQIACAHCTTLLQVPQSIFNWACPKCLTSNVRENKQCSECTEPKPKREKGDNPLLQCPVCQNNTAVPRSNAVKHMESAAETTKKYANTAATTAKQEYHYMKAAPQVFNCAHCTQLLQTPDYWICKACTSHNPRERDPELDLAGASQLQEIKAQPPSQGQTSTQSETQPGQQKPGSGAPGSAQQQPQKPKPNTVCSVCNTKRDPNEIEQVMCGKCQQATPIPKSNFYNNIKKSSVVASRAMTKALYDLSGTPYIVCDQCGENVKFPEEPKPKTEDGKELKQANPEGQALLTGAPPAVACPGCKKLWQRPAEAPKQPSAPPQVQQVNGAPGKR